MGDAEPRRSSRKRTASSRLKDMQSLGISTKQITKRLVDQSETSRNSAYGKKAKTEKEWLVAQSSAICNSDRKKTGKDENSSKTVLAGGDYDATSGKPQTDASDNSTDIVNTVLQPHSDSVTSSCLNNFQKFLKETCQIKRQYVIQESHHNNPGDKRQSDVKKENHKSIEKQAEEEKEQTEQEKEQTGEEKEQTEEEKEQAEEEKEQTEQEKEQTGEEKEQTEQEKEQAEDEKEQTEQEKEQAEEEKEQTEQEKEQTEQDKLQAEKDKEAEEAEEEKEQTEEEKEAEEEKREEEKQKEEQAEVEKQEAEEEKDEAEQEKVIRDRTPEKDITSKRHIDTGASGKDCDLYVNTVEEMAETQMKTFSDNEESTEKIKSCAFVDLVESCNTLKSRSEACHGAVQMGDMSLVANTCLKSTAELSHSEQDDVHVGVVSEQNSVVDYSNVNMVSSTESPGELGQLSSVYSEDSAEDNVTVLGNDTNNVLLGLDSATQLVCNVASHLPLTQTLQLTSQSQDDIAGTMVTFDNNTTYVLKTNPAKCALIDTCLESATGACDDSSQIITVQQTGVNSEDTAFFNSETAQVPCDEMVQSTSGNIVHNADGLPVCVVHIPNTQDVNQPLGDSATCSVIIDVVQLPGGAQPAGVSSIDSMGGTHADMVMVPAAKSMDGVFRCDFCSYTTDKKANWYKHKVHHTGRRPYACDKCPYSATTSSNLRRHQLIHAEVRSFQCGICDVKFRQKIHLERHVKYKHQEKSIECPHCDYHCANITPDLKIHLQRKHQIGTDQPQPPLRCAECSFTTVSRKDLKQHEKFHKSGPELKLYCEECCFVTDCQSRLKRHLLTHTRERPFSCALCDYRATQKEHISRHMKAKHDAEAPVGQHRRTHSTHENGDSTEQVVPATGQQKRRTPLTDFCNKEKLFACNFCTMSFAKLINLYKHISVQHGNTETDGLHACVVCEYRSTSRNNLLVHMRKHNANASVEPPAPCKLYSCVVCKFMHPKRQTLYNHMRKQHNMQIVVTRGNVHCLIDANDIADDDDTQLPATTVSSTDTEQVLISVDASNAALLQMSPGSHTDTASPGGSYGNSEAINAVQKLQVLSQAEDNVPLEGVVLSEDIVVLTDHQKDTLIDQEVETATDIQVCSEELSHLSSGDFVEINGDMYKVEFSNPK